jgi:hypothetical protein
VLREGIQRGLANDTAVEILAGLEEGEVVVMNPRTKFKDQVAELEALYKPVRTESDLPADEQDDLPGNPLAPSAESGDPPLAQDDRQSNNSGSDSGARAAGSADASGDIPSSGAQSAGKVASDAAPAKTPASVPSE